MPFKTSFPKPTLQRRLIFVILLLHVFLATSLTFMSFFLNWEDVIHHGVRQTSDFGDLADGDCAEHPWSRHVYEECQRASGVGAVGSNVRPQDCIRVCNDDPCATNRRIAARVTVWFTIISIIALSLFTVMMVVGLFSHVWLPLVAAAFVVSIVTTIASWLPFWLSRHGYLTSCPSTDFCPDGAARCNVHGFVFMFIASCLLVVGFKLTIFFDCIYLRWCGQKANEPLMLEDDATPSKPINA